MLINVKCPDCDKELIIDLAVKIRTKMKFNVDNEVTETIELVDIIVKYISTDKKDNAKLHPAYKQYSYPLFEHEGYKN